LCPVLTAAGHSVRAAVRGGDQSPAGVAETTVIPNIGPDTDWSTALDGIETVVHLAARVHVMNEAPKEGAAAHRRVNAEGTRRLAEAAAGAGLRRLLFVSSIKVYGDPPARLPLTEAVPPRPDDPYGESKWAAEQALGHIGAASGLQTVVLRPPLVYGPGTGGNMLSLLKLCRSSLPLPLGAANNPRSLIALGNLTDIIRIALEHPAAAGQTYVVRDGADLSVADLVRRLRALMGLPARLIPVPSGLLRAALAAVGRPGMAARLLDSLVLDDAKIRHDLGWIPPLSVERGLTETVAWFLAAAR
jgi:nucleoside-diphosphate-sugar epimerase